MSLPWSHPDSTPLDDIYRHAAALARRRVGAEWPVVHIPLPSWQFERSVERGLIDRFGNPVSPDLRSTLPPVRVVFVHAQPNEIDEP